MLNDGDNDKNDDTLDLLLGDDDLFPSVASDKNQQPQTGGDANHRVAHGRDGGFRIWIPFWGPLWTDHPRRLPNPAAPPTRLAYRRNS